MGFTEELERLHSLHRSGGLSDAEFARAKELLFEQSRQSTPDGPNPLQRFRRSMKDSYLGGICGGLGEHTAVPSWIWRVVFCLGVLCFGLGLVLYVLLWIFAPDANTPVSGKV